MIPKPFTCNLFIITIHCGSFNDGYIYYRLLPKATCRCIAPQSFNTRCSLDSKTSKRVLQDFKGSSRTWNIWESSWLRSNTPSFCVPMYKLKNIWHISVSHPSTRSQHFQQAPKLYHLIPSDGRTPKDVLEGKVQWCIALKPIHGCSCVCLPAEIDLQRCHRRERQFSGGDYHDCLADLMNPCNYYWGAHWLVRGAQADQKAQERWLWHHSNQGRRLALLRT